MKNTASIFAFAVLISVFILSGLPIHAESDAVDFSDAKKGIPFSQLAIQQQRKKLIAAEAPSTSERPSPYSTPMYYLLAEGFQDGIGSMDAPPNGNFVLDRNRPDLQEQLLRDWAELGLTSTLFLATPSQWKNPNQLQAIEDYVRLSRRYGLRVAVRLAGDSTLGGVEAGGWDVHPQNPDNRIPEYLGWIKLVAQTFKGQADHYILGDEVNANSWEMPVGDGETRRGIRGDEEQRWTPAVYMELFKQVSTLIKSIDPDARISMFGMGGLETEYVRELYELGFSRYGDGVAANVWNSPPDQTQRFVEMIRSYDPKVRFYSNGVGYVSTGQTTLYPVNPGPYELRSNAEQATQIARIMFNCFDAGWDSAPYYITVRQWVLPDGQTAPHWYGFFGFQDLILNTDGAMTVKRHPGWYAFQTIAHTFYDRASLATPGFDVRCTPAPTLLRAYERKHADADELLIILWHDNQILQSTLEIGSQRYRYPIQINLFNYHDWKDLPYYIHDGKTSIPISLGSEPVIIRMIRLNH